MLKINALDLLNWKRLSDQKDLNEQVIALHETILNVFQNYVPNKYELLVIRILYRLMKP